MRCLSCNRRLNDKEATRKYSNSGEYIDLCDRCFGYIADDVPDVDEPLGSSVYDDIDDGAGGELVGRDSEIDGFYGETGDSNEQW